MTRAQDSEPDDGKRTPLGTLSWGVALMSTVHPGSGPGYGHLCHIPAGHGPRRGAWADATTACPHCSHPALGRKPRCAGPPFSADCIDAGAVAVLRPGTRVLQPHLLRAVPAPDGLRQVRLLHPERLLQDSAGNHGHPAAHARRRPAHRRRTRRRRQRQGGLDRLLGQLADIPAPAGPTPRQISVPAQAALLPVIEINRRPT
jgi:hypothetical protein